VFELAGLLFNFSFTFERETIREEPLRQSMTANNICGTLAATFGEFHDHAAITGRDA